MSAHRGFAQIIIVAVIALVFGAVAVFGYQKYIQKPVPSPTPTSSNTTQTQITNETSPSPVASDETVYTDPGSANWKTYTNAKQKYSLNYPGDWVVKEEEASLRSDSITTFITFFTKDGNSIAVEVNPQGIGFGSENIKRETIIVAGKKVSKFTTLGLNEKTQSINTLIDKPEVGFIFQANETYLNNEEAVRVYDQILSTFKFTN